MFAYSQDSNGWVIFLMAFYTAKYDKLLCQNNLLTTIPSKTIEPEKKEKEKAHASTKYTGCTCTTKPHMHTQYHMYVYTVLPPPFSLFLSFSLLKFICVCSLT